MTKPADANDGQETSTSFARSLARRTLALLPYLEDAANRELNPEEATGLAWAAWGLTYAVTHALTPKNRTILDRLEIAINTGKLRLSMGAQNKARVLIELAREGDQHALRRMVAWATREGV